MRRIRIAVFSGGDALSTDVTRAVHSIRTITVDSIHAPRGTEPITDWRDAYEPGKERKKAQWKREINPTGKRGRRK